MDTLARTRRHDIDALRVIAFLLLILYHVGMFYVAEWEWHLKSAHLSEWLQVPMNALNRWRMPLLFLLSGIAIGLYDPRRGPSRFFAERSRRLLLPLAFGIVFVVAIQAYCQGVANGKVEPGFGAFLWRYWQFRPWPEGAFDGWEYGFTWNHLWYLPYLWAYSGLLLLALPLLHSRAGEALRTRFADLRGVARVVLPALPLALWFLWLAPRFEQTHALVDDWFNHAYYFTVFLYGYWMARDAGWWASLAAARRPLLVAALAMMAVYLPLIFTLGDDSNAVLLLATRVLRNLYCWTALLALLAWGHHGLNRPFRWLPWATESVFPWYVLHQTLIVLFAYWLAPLALGPVAEPVLLLAGTVLGCLAGGEIVRRVRWLRPLFGLKPLSARAAGSARGSRPASASSSA